MHIKNLKTLLLENTGIKQTIFKNTFWLTLAEGVSRFLGLALIIFAARILGAEEYGKFAFALSFVSILAILADLGLFETTIRELSRNKEAKKEYSSILSLKVFLSAIMFIVMFGISFFITDDPIIRNMIWILSAFILISGFVSMFHAFLRAREKMEYEAGLKIFQYLMMAGIGFFVLLKFPSAENLSKAYFFVNLILLFLVLLFVNFYVQFIRLSFNRTLWKRFLKMSWPLTLGFMLGWIYISIDSIMLGLFGRMIEVGWYNAASKITLVAIIPATLIANSFYPALSRFFEESKEKLQQIWDYQMKLMIILALPIMAGGLALAPKIINLFYGSDFAPSILIFQLLIFVSGISFLYYPLAMGLVVSDQQKKNFLLLFFGAIINVILNFILIPYYGFLGVATATIITCVFILFAAMGVLKRYTSIIPFDMKLLKALFASLFSSLAMFVIVSQPIILNFNIFSAIIVGMLIYAFILYFFYKFLYKTQVLSKM